MHFYRHCPTYKHHLRGVCCSDICHFGGVIVLFKAGQYVQEATGVMSISLIVSKDNIKLHLTSEHLDHFIWPSSLLDGGMLFHFTLVTLKCVETATRQIIERVLDGFHDLNLEDKVPFEGWSIVVNQVDFIRAYGLLETFIWDSGPMTIC
uniref:Putative ovule protein n=1 Tax=Solanum chacoense TaxID=4108 RepID=A0A0V0H8L4_SOLCH